MPENAAADELTDLRFSTRPGPAGERVAVRSDAGAQVLAVWSDNRAPTDLTDQLPDLIMLGWSEASHEAEDPHVPVEQVEVCEVIMRGHWEVYIADHTAEVFQVPTDTALGWLQASVVSLISTGVAYEALAGDPDLQDPPAAGSAPPPTSDNSGTPADGETP